MLRSSLVMAEVAKKRATYEDVLRAPANTVAEILDGELSVMPRPATPHAAAAAVLGEELGPPFKRGRGGPGGWILLDEPEIHLALDVLVPDLAGWRRDKLPRLPNQAFLEVAPDWACEVLSPSTEASDRARKLPIYAREGVSHVWLVDPLVQTLEVMRNVDRQWQIVAVYEADVRVRAVPFDAIELDLSLLWADVVR